MADVNSRRLLMEFDKLLRSTNPDLEFDTNIKTSTEYMFLTMAQEKVISDTFLQSPNLIDNIQAIQKRSDILRNLIKRDVLTSGDYVEQYVDGGHVYTIDIEDYWIFLKGVLKDSAFSALIEDVGGSNNIVNINIISHSEAMHITSDIYDQPIMESVPALIEADKTLVLYLDLEKETLFTSGNASIEISYLAHPPEITDLIGPSLPEAMYQDIVKLAVDDFIMNYKYKLRGNEPNK